MRAASGWPKHFYRTRGSRCALLRKDASFSAIAILTHGARNRREHDGVQRRQRDPAEAVAVSVRPRRSCCRGGCRRAESTWASRSCPGAARIPDVTQQTKAFASLGAFLGDSFNLTGAGEPVRLEGVRASAGLSRARRRSSDRTRLHGRRRSAGTRARSGAEPSPLARALQRRSGCSWIAR